MQSVKLERMENFKNIEAYNAIRTNIQFCGKAIKTICLTSCIPNEGKSIVSFSLASSMAESGKKVLFIDADLRKSVLLGRLKAESAVLGLTHYLTGQKELEEVLYTSDLEHPDIIFTGPVPPNPSELLNSKLFREMIGNLKEVYDYIIIDTPPLGAVIDSAIVASCCDGVILVVQSNAISHKFARSVVKQLEKGNCKILGAILNKVDINNDKYYGKYYGNY